MKNRFLWGFLLGILVIALIMYGFYKNETLWSVLALIPANIILFFQNRKKKKKL